MEWEREPFEARTFEGCATSDLFEELTLALGGIPEGARVRWSGVSVEPLLRKPCLCNVMAAREHKLTNVAVRRQSRE